MPTPKEPTKYDNKKYRVVKKRSGSKMTDISKFGLQSECYNCGKRYNENLSACPHCKTVDLDNFGKIHRMRRYKQVDDIDEII